MAYCGFGTATILGAISGFDEGYIWNVGGDSISRIEKIVSRDFFGLFGGVFNDIVYGFILLEENNLNFAKDYRLKFDNNKNSYNL
tara:strand:+ start:497 stop:751 length:255 start_codon:yes stop_codon:yes gene_type:complete